MALGSGSGPGILTLPVKRHGSLGFGDAFAFLEELGYAAFELAAGGKMVPVTTRRDGDFWFIPSEERAA